MVTMICHLLALSADPTVTTKAPATPSGTRHLMTSLARRETTGLGCTAERTLRGARSFADVRVRIVTIGPGSQNTLAKLAGVSPMSFPPRLTESLRRALGDQAAEVMVSWMEDVDSRRSEGAQLRESIRADFAQFRADFAEFRESMRGDLAELRQEMRDGDAGLREEIRAVGARLGGELQAADGRLGGEIKQAKYDLIKWS